MPLELGWSIIPFIISIGIFVWASVVFFHIVRAPDQTLEIYSTGKRWMWRFQHVDGQREINELHVPVGRAVKVVFTSEDVLHDLFIPAFRVKADAVPGRYSAIWFEATKVGEYHLFCAEYCGTNHSGMIGTVFVMEPADYQAWLSGGGQNTAGGTLIEQGQQLFTQLACVTCHLADGSGTRTVARRRIWIDGHARQRDDGAGRRRLPARVDSHVAGQDRRGVSTADADLPGPRQRGRTWPG